MITLNPCENMKDITPQLFQEYYQKGRLWDLTIKFPPAHYRCGPVYPSKITLDLKELFTKGIKIKDFENQTSINNTEVICVYGGVLYKHFIPKKKIREKKWLFFGSYVEREYRLPPHIPNDFDVMFITREAFSQDNMIITNHYSYCKRRNIKVPHNELIVYPETRLEAHTYNDDGTSHTEYEEIIGYTPVRIEPRGLADDYRSTEVIPLHITYRSLDQFLNGIGRGDELSESVVRYGIPLVGAERFYEIIKNIASPRREALHQVEWREDKNGVLQGRIS